MECPTSPSHETIRRSQLHFRKNLCQSILQQEKHHAASKRPRRTRFVMEADAKLQRISENIIHIRKRVSGIHSDFKILEGKVNRLDVIKEQACFFMSPKRILNEAANKKSPMKLTYYYNPNQSCDEGFVSGGDSSPRPGAFGATPTPTPPKLVEFLRRRKLVSITLSKILTRLNKEKRFLEDIFEDNITILRYKRAEKCLIKMIGLQSKLKTLGKELEGLEERLFSEDYADEDYGYNLIQ